MQPDFSTTLWRMLDKIRGTISAEDYVSAISQIFVIGALAQQDKQFAKIAYPEGGANLSYLPELLDGAYKACERLNIDPQRELVDPTDRCWSGMSAFQVQELLSSSLLLDLLVDGPDEVAAELMSWAMKESRISLGPTPEVASLMRALLGDTDHLLLPFNDSSATLLVVAPNVRKISAFPETQDMLRLVSRAAFVAGINIHVKQLDMHAMKGFEIKANALLIAPGNTKYARNKLAHSGNLPYMLDSIKKLSTEQLALALVASRVKGRAAVLVPAGLLFQAGSGAQFREWLVCEAGLTTVIELPGRLLANSSIASAVLVLEPDMRNRDSIRLVTGESERYLDEPRKGRYILKRWQQLFDDTQSSKVIDEIIDVSTSDIEANDYILTPGRYRAREGSGLDELIAGREVAALSSVANILRSAALTKPKGKAVASFIEVLISDFGDDGLVNDGSKVRQFDERSAARAARNSLRSGDILIGTRGTIGKVAMVADDAAENLLAGQTSVAIRLQQDSPIRDPVYLLRYLSLPEVREYLESLAGGATIRFIRNKDLGNLPVLIPLAEDHAKVAAVHEAIQAAVSEAKHLQQKAQELSNTAFASLGDGGAE